MHLSVTQYGSMSTSLSLSAAARQRHCTPAACAGAEVGSAWAWRPGRLPAGHMPALQRMPWAQPTLAAVHTSQPASQCICQLISSLLGRTCMPYIVTAQVLPECVASEQSMDRHCNQGATAVTDMACQVDRVGATMCWRSPWCMHDLGAHHADMTQHSAIEVQLALAWTGCTPLQLWPSWMCRPAGWPSCWREVQESQRERLERQRQPMRGASQSWLAAV